LGLKGFAAGGFVTAMIRNRRFRGRRGQALLEYVSLVLFVAGLAVSISLLIVPVFRTMFMQKLIRAVITQLH
jgi:hypothetical protein